MIWRPRFPIKRVHFHYRMAFATYIAQFSFDFPTFMVSYFTIYIAHTNFQHPTELWMTKSDYVPRRPNCYCPCAVSYDLSFVPKTTCNNFLTPNYLFIIRLLWVHRSLWLLLRVVYTIRVPRIYNGGVHPVGSPAKECGGRKSPGSVHGQTPSRESGCRKSPEAEEKCEINVQIFLGLEPPNLLPSECARSS